MSALLVVVLRLLFEERTRKELEGRNFASEGLGMKEERKEGRPGNFEGSGLGRKRGRNLKAGIQAQAFTRC